MDSTTQMMLDQHYCKYFVRCTVDGFPGSLLPFEYPDDNPAVVLYVFTVRVVQQKTCRIDRLRTSIAVVWILRICKCWG